MTLREKIEVMEAFERGEEIELKNYDNDWIVYGEPSWDWVNNEYRIKPKPKKTVTIEKWLCKAGFADAMYIIEVNKEYFDTYEKSKVKLLKTYEVEL